MKIVAIFLFFFIHHVYGSTELPPQAELGRYLFNDVRLSKLGNRSCSLCHNPELGWTNRFSRTPNIYGEISGMNTPSILNSFLEHNENPYLLKEKIFNPIFSSDLKEMATSPDELIKRLNDSGNIYYPLFNSAYGDIEITVARVIDSLADYLKTISSMNTAYHRYLNGQEDAMTKKQIEGMSLFNSSRLSCSSCHSGPRLNKKKNESYDIKSLKNMDEVRVASLINITKTAPWGLEGNYHSLSSVIDDYAIGKRYFLVKSDIIGHGIDPMLIPKYQLTKDEKDSLLSFLEALETPKPVNYTNPESPFCQLVKLKNKKDNSHCLHPFKLSN